MQIRLRPFAVSVLGLAGIFLIGWLDYATGPQLACSLFYFVPIALIVWGSGFRPGILAAFLSAGVQLAADMFVNHPYLSSAVLFSNAGIRLGMYLIIVFLLEKRKAMERSVQAGVTRLRASEERFRQIVETASEGILATDADLKITFANGRLAAMLGCSPREVVGRKVDDFIFEEDLADHRRRLDARRRGKAEVYERRFRRGDGGEFWAIVSAATLRDSNGCFGGSFATFTDITERRRSEEALRKSEAKYRELADSISDVFFAFDSELRYTFWNKASEELTGLPAGEALGKRFLEVFPDTPETRRWEKNYLEVLQTRRPCTFVADYRVKDKKLFHEISAYPARDGLVVFARDITPRIQVEEALRESEERFRSLYENAMIGLYRTTPEGEILMANPALLRMIAFSSLEELKNRNLEKEGFEPFYPRRRFKELIEREGQIVGLESAWKRRDGSTIWVRESASAIRDADGRTLFYEGTVEDITERMLAEQALRESEEKHRNLVERANDGIIIFQDGLIIFANARAAEIWGGNLEELIGTPLADHVQPQELPRVQNHYKKRMAAEDVPPVYETVLKRKDGRLVYAELNAGRIEFRGKPADLVIVRDITERKLAEEALRESDERLKLIFEYAPDAYYLTDLKGKFVDGNRAAEILTGYDREELIGKNVLKEKLLPLNQVPKAASLLTQSAMGKPTGPEEFLLRRKEGSQVPVEVRTYPVKIKDQTLVLGIARNISERKEAERVRALLATGIEDLSEIIILTDGKSNVQYVNQAMERITGFSKEQALGHPLKKILLTADTSLPNAVHEAFKKGTVWKGRTTAKKVNGSEYTIEARVAPVRDKDSSVISCALLIRDITQEEKVKERLIRSEKMESLGTLAGGIAHDFNNILTSILGFTELVMEELPRGTLNRDNLEQVLLAGKRGKDMVKEILAFSRQEKQERVPVQVRRVVEETARLLRASIPSTIEIRLDLRSGAIVLASPTQISQILMNLCTNAVQAMEDRGGVLEVRLEDSELDEEFIQGHPGVHQRAQLKLTVSDTGHGIDPAILGRIFDPFFTTKEKGKGTGMGLPVVHGIVKSLGGEISVYSKPGMGTTINVFLPVSEPLPQPEETEETFPPGGTERILFVDDEAQIVGIGKQILGRLGYKVVARTNPVEALKAFRARPDRFDLVITDLTMPNMTGDSLAAELKHIRPDIPIILCTGFSKRITKENARFLAIEEYLMKPLLRKDMAEAVRRVLDRVRVKE